MRLFLFLVAMGMLPLQALQPKSPLRPVRPGVPVEIREGELFAAYVQPRADTASASLYNLASGGYRDAVRNQKVEWKSLHAYMRTIPEAQTDLTASTRWWRAGQVSAISGVLFLAVGSLRGDDQSGAALATSLFGGLGLLATGAWFGILSDRRMADAVRKYNATLPAEVGLDWDYTPERSSVALQVRF